jgi:large subunit ribosomal protein L23
MAKALHLYDVLVRPVVTEKANLLSADHNQYVFQVALNSNKIQVKEAIEIIFDVDVLDVNTIIMPAKRARRGRKTGLRSKQWKKAIVTLARGQKIDLFNA